MTRKVRRTFFYFLVLVFIVFGTGISFYSTGWRIDFDNFTLKQTGGIFIRTEPREVTIHLDEKKIEQRKWLMVSGTLIKNLIPRNYELSISQDGYREWNKNIPVEANRVSEIENAVILPEKIESFSFASSTKDFWITENGPVILGKKLEYKDNILYGKEFSGFMGGEEKIVSYNPETGVYSLNDLKDRSTLNLNLMFANLRNRFKLTNDSSPIVKILTRSNNGEEAVAVTEKGIYVFHISKLELSLLKKGAWWKNVELLNGSSLIAENKDSIAIFDLVNKKTIYEKELDGEIKKIRTGENRTAGVLTENGSLYVIKNNEAQKIAHSVNNFEIGGEKILFLNKDEEKITSYNIGKGNYLKIYYDSLKEMDDLLWIGKNHFISEIGGDIYLTEITENPYFENKFIYVEKIVEDDLKKAVFDEKEGILYYLNRKDDLRKIEYFKGIEL